MNPLNRDLRKRNVLALFKAVYTTDILLSSDHFIVLFMVLSPPIKLKLLK